MNNLFLRSNWEVTCGKECHTIIYIWREIHFAEVRENWVAQYFGKCTQLQKVLWKKTNTFQIFPVPFHCLIYKGLCINSELWGSYLLIIIGWGKNPNYFVLKWSTQDFENKAELQDSSGKMWLSQYMSTKTIGTLYRIICYFLPNFPCLLTNLPTTNIEEKVSDHLESVPESLEY